VQRLDGRPDFFAETLMIRPFPLPQKLPYRDQKPYIRPAREPKVKGAKAVTLAASIQYKGGVVLCADSLMTHGTSDESGSFAHYERKVFADDGKYFAAGVTGTGMTFELRAFAESFLKRARQQESEDASTVPDIASILDNELESLASKLGAPPQLDLLVAEISPPRTVRVFRTQGLVVRPARPVEVVGIGETSLISYLTDTLYSHELTVNQASALGVFFVYAGKKYCPQYCGGATNVCVLRTEYPLYRWLNADEIMNVESILRDKGRLHLKDLLSEAGKILD
jgi:20S proteasome alpha/beta subunit